MGSRASFQLATLFQSRLSACTGQTDGRTHRQTSRDDDRQRLMPTHYGGGSVIRLAAANRSCAGKRRHNAGMDFPFSSSLLVTPAGLTLYLSYSNRLWTEFWFTTSLMKKQTSINYTEKILSKLQLLTITITCWNY